VGAALITTAGAWIAFSVVSRPSAARAAGAEALRQGCDDPRLANYRESISFY
jgi:hypothetical protein